MVILMSCKDEDGWGNETMAMAGAGIVLTLYLGQKLVNMLERSEWRQKLKAEVDAKQAKLDAEVEAAKKKGDSKKKK
jgi:hypothetical protein